MPLRRIWVTRAEPGAAATAARLHGLGFEPVVAPVLETRPITGAAIDLAGIDSLAFTSAAGVAAFAALTPARDRTAFAVGDATAEAARDAGFGDVRSAHGDVHALAALIADAAPRPSLVLNPTAAEPADDLPARLAERGVAARAVVVYQTHQVDPAAPPARLDGVLIHSAKGARAVARWLAGTNASALTAFVISAAAAAPVAELGFRRIAVASSPNEAALLDLLDA